MRNVIKVEVGGYENRVGYTAIYEDGTREHHLFAPEIALQLADKLKAAAEKMIQGFTDKTIVTESVSVGLLTSEGEKDEEKIH